MAGEQRLVGRHHMFARTEGRLDRGLCGAFRAADQFDEYVDPVALGQLHGIVEPLETRDVRRCASSNGLRAETAVISIALPQRARYPRPVYGEQFQQSLSDNAQPGDTYPQSFRHNVRLSLSACLFTSRQRAGRYATCCRPRRGIS